MRVSVNFTAALVLCLLSGFLIASDAEAGSDRYWSDQYTVPDFYGTFFDGVECNGELVILGDFYLVDDKPINNMAVFDGTEWRELEPSLAADPATSIGLWGDRLVIGVYHRVWWSDDNCNWKPLSWHMPLNKITEYVTYHDELYVSGDIGVYRWRNFKWEPIIEHTSADTVCEVSSMTVYDDKLIIAGDIHIDGGTWVTMTWDGSTLDVLPGADQEVEDVVVYDGKLLVSGYFGSFAGIPMRFIAAYDGVEWQPLPISPPGRVHYMAVYRDKLIASGCHSMGSHDAGPSLRQWDGSTWSVITENAVGLGKKIFVANDRLYFNERFVDPVDGRTSRLSYYDGTTCKSAFSNTGLGIKGYICDMTRHLGDLVVVGSFIGAGQEEYESIARFDGTSWHSLNYNIDIPDYVGFGTVASFQNTLYAYGGRTGLIRLSGNQWVSVENEIFGLKGDPTGDDAKDSKAIPTDDFFVFNNAMYLFRNSHLNDYPITTLYRWNGNTATVVPTPPEIGHLSIVGEFEGNLVLGGRCVPEIDIDYFQLFRWTGTEYIALGGYMYGDFSDLCEYKGELYVSGNVKLVDDPTVVNLMKWDGEDWVPVGGACPDGTVYDMVVHNGNLYVVGAFETIEGVIRCNQIACWNGDIWSSLGSGMGEDEYKVAFAAESALDQLFIGGEFRFVGGNVSSGIAAWSEPGLGCCVGNTGNIDDDPQDMVSLGDLSALIDHLFISLSKLACPAEANLDDDPENVSLGDLTALIDHLFISLNPTKPCP